MQLHFCCRVMTVHLCWGGGTSHPDSSSISDSSSPVPPSLPYSGPWDCMALPPLYFAQPPFYFAGRHPFSRTLRPRAAARRAQCVSFGPHFGLFRRYSL